MSLQTETKKRKRIIREAIRPIFTEHGCLLIPGGSFEADLVSAIAPLMPGKKEMSADTWALLGGNDPELNAKLEAEDLMRERAEKALNKTPDWDGKQSPWCNYHKKLVRKEEKTGFTIEQFVKWWNSSDFRKQQGIWLNPTKIDEFWVTAINETETTQTYEQTLAAAGYK